MRDILLLCSRFSRRLSLFAPLIVCLPLPPLCIFSCDLSLRFDVNVEIKACPYSNSASFLDETSLCYCTKLLCFACNERSHLPCLPLWVGWCMWHLVDLCSSRDQRSRHMISMKVYFVCMCISCAWMLCFFPRVRRCFFASCVLFSRSYLLSFVIAVVVVRWMEVLVATGMKVGVHNKQTDVLSCTHRYFFGCGLVIFL